QQPLRARMCGFGEKDRRPCTPPPILQLFIYDRVTGQHIDIEHIDTSFFTATCNLFSADMDTEMDLIRQRNSHDSGHGSSSSSAVAAAAAAAAAAMMQKSIQQQTQLDPPMSVGGSPSDTVRNLIGSSISTGSKLQNLDSSLGIFFVFPDLSIRKDGEYRLRFSFFDLRSETGDLIRTSSPIMARTFSDPFKVYSAKQFPGMIESTSLSKHFAKQGVKIPVRKES
ncbi:hypothetical protein GQ54DRAFT_237303, partial [Martensiomyces pterosporus]